MKRISSFIQISLRNREHNKVLPSRYLANYGRVELTGTCSHSPMTTKSMNFITEKHEKFWAKSRYKGSRLQNVFPERVGSLNCAFQCKSILVLLACL